MAASRSCTWTQGAPMSIKSATALSAKNGYACKLSAGAVAVAANNTAAGLYGIILDGGTSAGSTVKIAPQGCGLIVEALTCAAVAVNAQVTFSNATGLVRTIGTAKTHFLGISLTSATASGQRIQVYMCDNPFYAIT